MAKEMSLSGDWLNLSLGGQTQFNKPPLLIWVTAFLYKFWGVSELTSRLFPALTGLGTVIVTYFFGRQLLNRWMGFLAALVLISTSHFIQYSRMAMPDVPFTFFMTLSLYFFWRGIQRNRFFVFSGIAIGLSVMTIGFQAFFVFPLLWTYLFMSGRQDIFNRSTYWVGVMIAALLALPWHLYQMMVFRDMLWRAVDPQFFTSIRSWMGGEFFYYVRVLVNKDHPWILFAIFSAPFFLIKAIRDKDEESIFLSAWIFFILIFISFLRVKRFEYVVPLYPALSITVAYWLGQLFRDHTVMWVRGIFILIMILHVPYSHIFDHDGSRDIRAIREQVSTKTAELSTIYVYRYNEAPAVMFYFSRPSKRLDQVKEFNERMAVGNFYCILRSSDWNDLGGDPLLRKYSLAVLARSGEILLVGPKQ